MKVIALQDTHRPRPHMLLLRVLIVFVAGILSVGFVFRHQLLGGFSVLFGDRYDGIIETSILEHLRHVWSGQSFWSETGYFYPYKDSLAYNDGYFLYGLIYAPLRALGFDPFLASESVNIFLKGIGYVGMVWLLRCCLRLGWIPVVLGGVLFTVANNSFLHAYHAQLFSVTLAPWLTIILWQTSVAAREQRHWPFALWGAAAALLFAAWVITAYYMAWFYAYYAFVALIIAVLWRRQALICFVSRWRDHSASFRPWLLPVGLVLGVAMLSLTPFLVVYLPKAIETRALHTASWTPAFLDTINIGYENWLHGTWYHALNNWYRPDMREAMPAELISGIPPILFMCCVVAVVWSLRYRSWPMRVLTAALLISWLLTIHIIGWNGHKWSLWKLAHSIIPGASGIRTIARYQIFLTFPIVVLVMMWFHNLWIKTRRQQSLLGQIALLVLAVLLIVENINRARPDALDRQQEWMRLQQLPPPPHCQAFTVTNPREGSSIKGQLNRLYSPNVDAMLIAAVTGLPTINGVSTYNPPDWDFADITRPDAPARAKAYAQHHNIHNLCGLDLQTLRWD